MKLFEPIMIERMELKNRIVMSPMVMNSCVKDTGMVNNWHRTHYTSRAVGQVGLIMLEATAVTSQGRISPYDLGVWSDDHVAGLQELVQLAHEHDAKMGIQLAHAGRKSEIDEVKIAPSAIAFDDKSETPEEMTTWKVEQSIQAFIDAAARAVKAGLDCIEIHAAHGYLINQFLSPLANKRTDEYGGDRDRRFRFLEEVIKGVKRIWSGALFVRISASEYHPEGNSIEDQVYFTAKLKALGVHLIDCSSGGVVQYPIETYPGYQVQFAERIRKENEMLTGAVGLISTGAHAEDILRSGRADLIFLGRELLRNPYWPLAAAKELGVTIQAPKQYGRGW